MENSESKISKSTGVLMVCVAVFIDLVQFLLNFIPIVGWMFIWLINAAVWLTFYIWFRSKGVSFSSSKRMASLTGGFVIELIPIINALPAWTLATVLIISSTWREEMSTKKEGAPTAISKIGPSTSTKDKLRRAA